MTYGITQDYIKYVRRKLASRAWTYETCMAMLKIRYNERKTGKRIGIYVEKIKDR